MKKKFFLSALLISLFGLAAAKPVQADTSIADIQKRGELVVGVKQDVPNFGYKDPKTGTYSGIETDLAKMVADELKVKIRYVPVTAQTRGPLLDNEQVDMDIATFTITDERKKLYNFTSPYYTDASGFLVNKSAKIKKIEDLNGKTIGVAQGSITQRLITELGKKKGLKFKFVELGSYPELITSLHAHRIDAFSVDHSILSGYTSKRTALLDDSFKPSDYSIVTKKSNTELNDYLDNLVTKWSKDGSLQKLYDRYKLKPSSHTADQGGYPMTDLSSWTAYFQDFGQFFNGFLFTLALAIGSFILAMVLGIFFGAMSTSKRPILRILARIFVEFYQNTPLLVQFVIVFYGLPLISDHIIMIPIYWTAVLCVGLYHGAYIAEVIRSGIQSIPSGQMEAALSQGFTYISAMRLIILPQAFRIILPPLTNQIVNLIKNTSTVAIISGVDLMFVTKSWSALNGNYIPAFLGAALLYFALCFPVAQFGRKMEQANKKAYSL